ncbi:hypothetical protein [Hymenobacter nivis]|uniref:DUF4136 domain-containing protein n=1 Tax=Hymenobacter nivis TaxID=1850093 RepID=A0A2Z3GEA7_9BACT|nr:hypothetical protein [Hymenobacter nivis]AWM31823.1 hypothetical protein DDQ68_02900 [Hymenobacter nivis]
MRLRYPLLSAAGALLALAGCRTQDSPAPDLGNTYYPVAVGTYRAYQVVDTTWNNYVRTVGTPYQLREAITGTYADAAGQLAYRVERARRATTADAWVADSVFALSVSLNAVVLNRGNKRTVEAVFPARTGRIWNFNAFNNNSADTVNADTRSYRRVGAPYTTAVPGGTARAYPTTATAVDTALNNTNVYEDNLYYLRTYQQVLAQGVGPVLRRRRRFIYTGGTSGALPVPGQVFAGYIHRETLIDAGNL